MPAGRPLKFDSAHQIRTIGEAYFESCRENDKPITITGLCMALDTFRPVLLDYASGKYDETDSEFSSTIKALKQVCENYAEIRLFTTAPTGAIFALKNYGWSDKTDLNLGGQDGNPIQAAITVEFVKARE